MTPNDPTEERIARLHADAEPPADWEARVWAGVARARPAPRRRWLGALLPLGAAAALLAVLLRPTGEGEAPGLALSVRQGGEVVRGRDPAAGDVLAVEARTGGAARAELRIYRGDAHLVLRCGEGPGCRRGAGALAAEVALPAPGEYRALLLLSAEALPAPAGALDADVAAAAAAGARFELSAPLEVY